MLKIIDLMEIYRITQHKESNLDYFKDIINAAGVNAALDREQLSLEMLRQCGAREPRYNTTETFKTFAVNFFKVNSSYIDRTLELIAKEYDMLDTYNMIKNEDIDRKHTDKIDETRTNDLTNTRTNDLTDTRTDNLTDTRTDDLTKTRTDNLTERKTGSYIDDHYVSAENESGVMLRTRDTHTETDEAGSGTLNTGTQTTADTGTQTKTNTGTQTTTNTGTQTIEDTGTVKTEGDNVYTHDDNIKTTEHGYKASPNLEFFNALARNEFNIYEELTEKFAEKMCLGVF